LGDTAAHGTHVTGIIAGRPKAIQGFWGNGQISGVAPDATILFRKNDWSTVPFGYLFDLGAFRDTNTQISNHSYRFLDFWNPGKAMETLNKLLEKRKPGSKS